jgi:hypothetical protein
MPHLLLVSLTENICTPYPSDVDLNAQLAQVNLGSERLNNLSLLKVFKMQQPSGLNVSNKA